MSKWVRLFLACVYLIYFNPIWAQDPIGWRIITPFPNEVKVGQAYEQIYELQSNLPIAMPSPLTVTHNTFGSSDYQIDDQCTGKLLAPAETCHITVRYTPSVAGDYHLQFTLNYFNDVVPLPVQSMTASGNANTTLIEGQVLEGLPTLTFKGINYPVKYTFTNKGNTVATQLNLQIGHPGEFSEEQNTCAGKTSLAPNESCEIAGAFLPLKEGKYTIDATMYYAESSMPATVSMSTKTETVNVIGALIQGLPATMSKGETASISIRYTNQGTQAATSVLIHEGFTRTGGTCGSTLASGASCEITGTYTAPNEDGFHEVRTTYHYAENPESVIVVTNTTVGTAHITAKVETALPEQTAPNSQNPVIFVFTNEGNINASGITATTNYPTGFTVFNNTCTETLAAQQTCTIEGVFEPKAVDDYIIEHTLHYSGGEAVASTKTTTVDYSVIGEVEEPLPPIINVNQAYSVQFTFTNHSVTAITELKVTTEPGGLSVSSDECTGKTLAANESCTVAGNFTAIKADSYEVSASLTFKESTNPVKVVTSTEAEEVKLTGEVTKGLPDAMGVGDTATVEFTYSNPSSLPATNLSVHTQPEYFKVESNTCTETLAAGASCQVKGTFTSSDLGDREVSATLTYTENSNPVTLITKTHIEKIELVGYVDTPLPTDVSLKSENEVVFSFQNKSNLTARNLTYTKNYPKEGFTEIENTCEESLAPGETCTIKGSFIPQKEEEYSIGVTLNYPGGEPIVLSTQTNAIKFILSCEVTEALPAESHLGEDYPVVFTCTNQSPFPATNVVVNLTHPSEFVEQTESTDELPNPCSGLANKILAPSASCTISGQFIPENTTLPNQPIKVAAEFTYNEGDPESVSTGTQLAGTVILTGEILERPSENMTTSTTPVPVTFQYTNNGNIAATEVSIVPAYHPAFKETSNTCKETLAPNTSCQITGELDISQPGLYLMGANLFSKESDVVSLNFKTEVAQGAVIGEVERGFDSYTQAGSQQHVNFRFTNKTDITVTGVQIQTDYPAEGFTQTENSCTTILEPQQSCEVQGILKTTTLGLATARVTFKYNEGGDIALSSSTTVVASLLEGFVDQGLADVTVVGNTYPVKFIIHNPGSEPSAKITAMPVANQQSEITNIVDECSDNPLPAKSSCSITANFKPLQEQTYILNLVATYGSQSLKLRTDTVSIASGANRFRIVNVGYGGFLRSSPTWSTWTTHTRSGVYNLEKVAYSPTLQLFAVVGEYNWDKSLGTILISPNLSSWTRIVSSLEDDPSSVLFDVYWNSQLAHFITVGQNGSIRLSTNGYDWLKQQSPVTGSLRAIAWSPQLNRYCVVGANGAILTSQNGKDWQQQESGVTSTLYGIDWSSAQKQFVVITGDGDEAILTSPDGINWTNEHVKIYPSTTYNYRGRTICWTPLYENWVSGGTIGYFGYSKDGKKWTRHTDALITPYVYKIVWSPHRQEFYGASNSSYIKTTDGNRLWRTKRIAAISTFNVRGAATGAVLP